MNEEEVLRLLSRSKSGFTYPDDGPILSETIELLMGDLINISDKAGIACSNLSKYVTMASNLVKSRPKE